jgi:hypothetical protein
VVYKCAFGSGEEKVAEEKEKFAVTIATRILKNAQSL